MLKLLRGRGAGGGLGGSKKNRGTAITSLAGLLKKHVGLRDSSVKYQKSFVCLGKMSLISVMTAYV